MKEHRVVGISQQNISLKKKHSLLFFILFPALAMLLGWGLRGFIGGGPYGAMIPGAMVMLAICMLLDIPCKFGAIAVAFGTVGIAMGGEMTYGQTLGFLRNPGTMWWGFAGTSLKGGVWGLTGGLFIGLGLVRQRINIKTILTGFLIFLIAFVIGLKLINDPKILYFSNPFDRPRNESWAGLLFGAVGLLVYLKIKITAKAFRSISRFAWYGLIGGTLGFGPGSLWIAIGTQYGAHFLIVDWWKMMEFSFGLILGGFLGYAAWCSDDVHNNSDHKQPVTINKSFAGELMLTIVLGFFIYGAMPVFESYVDMINKTEGIVFGSLATIGRVLVNFTCIGCLLIITALRWPSLAFQIAVTLTFCHCMIDLVTDANLFPALQSSALLIAMIVTAASFVISVLVALFQRKQFVLKSMFLILVWSTMAVAIIRMLAHGIFLFPGGHSFIQIIIGDLFVFNVFVISAIIVSIMVVKNKAFQARVPGFLP
ncbi:MAG: hypothetical protein ABI472_03205 [Ginsengibacter sp.]